MYHYLKKKIKQIHYKNDNFVFEVVMGKRFNNAYNIGLVILGTCRMKAIY